MINTDIENQLQIYIENYRNYIEFNHNRFYENRQDSNVIHKKVLIWFLCTQCNYGYSQLARVMYMNHSTIKYHIDMIDSICENDTTYIDTIQDIIDNFLKVNNNDITILPKKQDLQNTSRLQRLSLNRIKRRNIMYLKNLINEIEYFRYSNEQINQLISVIKEFKTWI